MIKPHPLTSLAKALRSRQTDAEKQLWMNLRDRQLKLAKFKRQYAVGGYIVDFICIEKKLIIEVDGGQHMEHQRHDATRTAYLNGQGFHVLRFWNNEVLSNLEGVLERMGEYL